MPFTTPSGGGWDISSGPDVYFNPTNATYNPATGDFVITVASHSLSVGEGIVFSTGSFAFTCDMDGNQSTKFYCTMNK